MDWGPLDINKYIFSLLITFLLYTAVISIWLSNYFFIKNFIIATIWHTVQLIRLFIFWHIEYLLVKTNMYVLESIK